ncbi:uncharacterized protein LOC136091654 [Hydra vulgaris]|uniref:Uncharacterized protein LOC136091654 n=1 Tax=Hydra vulgaris TaxID=6087 RepID=A0ABM4DLK9_HYDVU
MVFKKYTNLISSIMISILVNKYLHGAVELFSIYGQIDVKVGNLVTTFNIFPKEYEITFEAFLSSYTSGFYRCACGNLFRFTTGNDDSFPPYENRILGFWVFNSGTLFFDSFINQTNVRLENVLFRLGLKKFNISQLLFHGAYVNTLQINGETIASRTNTDAKDIYNVSLYFSDPWFLEQPGYVRNLLVTKGCSESNFYCKPQLKVQLNWVIIENLSNISFQLTYNSSQELAFNVVWEYFLPTFLTIQSENTPLEVGRLNSSNLKYTISKLQNNGVCQSFTVKINNDKCFFNDSYVLEIPIKLYYENSAALSWTFFRTVKKSFKELCKIFVMPIDQNHVSEYYGQGLYWDDLNFQIYLCINQYVLSFQKSACYFSRDDGLRWQAMDLRVGAVLGHHTSNRELYAIHRNQKLYLMFHNIHKKWLAVTKDDFEINIVNNLDWTNLKLFKEDVEYSISFATRQWMGKRDGLYFKNLTNQTWVQRFKWNL